MEDKYLNDISEIKNMMKKSSQFISLSGLAGVLAGFYALIGAFFANNLVDNFFTESFIESDFRKVPLMEYHLMIKLVLVALLVLISSLFTAIILTYQKAKKKNESIWNLTAKRLLVNFLIPLTTGGVFGLILLKNQYYDLLAPVTLIFYGLACVNASKYTLRDVRYLGMTIIFIGLLASSYANYGLQFWALGFGVCHIFYGALMHYKYDRI